MLKGFSAQTGSYSSFFTEAQQLKEMPRIIWTKILPLPEDIYISDILALKTMPWTQDYFTEKWGRGAPLLKQSPYEEIKIQDPFGQEERT